MHYECSIYLKHTLCLLNICTAKSVCAPLLLACAHCCFSLFLQYAILLILLYENKILRPECERDQLPYILTYYLIKKSKGE